MEDETLELHFETIGKSIETTHSALKEVAAGQRDHASRNERDFKLVNARQDKAETRVASMETSLATLSEKMRSSPLLTLGTGTLGGGGLIGAIVYYFQQGGPPIP